ncbi:MAG: hypothetical protein ABW194_01830 [Novosphingobium sp.]
MKITRKILSPLTLSLSKGRSYFSGGRKKEQGFDKLSLRGKGIKWLLPKSKR